VVVAWRPEPAFPDDDELSAIPGAANGCRWYVVRATRSSYVGGSMRTIPNEAHLRMTMPDVPYGERGRVLRVFLVLLASYEYFFPRLNNWSRIPGCLR
jgi:hypothetical protein